MIRECRTAAFLSDHAGPPDLGYYAIVFFYKHIVPTALESKEGFRPITVFCVKTESALPAFSDMA